MFSLYIEEEGVKDALLKTPVQNYSLETACLAVNTIPPGSPGVFSDYMVRIKTVLTDTAALDTHLVCFSC